MPHSAGPVQTGQAQLRLDQLQRGLHPRGLQLLAARGGGDDKWILNKEFFCEVEYNIYNENQTVVETRPGKLFPNVKGCGYPPIVECEGK